MIDPQAAGIQYRGLIEEHQTYLSSLPADSPQREVFSEPGRYAAARGDDYIVASERGGLKFPVVLNRTALIVEGNG